MEQKLIQWSSALGADIIWMDYQHQMLIEKINDLYKAILEKKGRALISEMIGFLDEYVHGHFALEERYMKEFGYPDRSRHFEAHDQFKKNLQDLKSLQDSKSELLAESLCYDLFEWFNDHIRDTDKNLGAFLKANMAR